MGEKIASLFAEIGADTGKFKDGIAQTKTGLEKTGSIMGNLKTSFLSSWTEMSSAINIAKEAVGVVNGAIDATVGATVEYAAQVRDLSRATGMSAEEASKMIQTADDLTVSYDSLKLSLRAATSQGITLSTEALAKLSEQYNALAPGVERNEFLMKNFGRAGQDMAKIMEAGGDALRQMGEAQSANLILTQKQVDQAREYEKSIDALGDSWMGVKYVIGNNVLPSLVFLGDHLQSNIDLISNAKGGIMGMAGAWMYASAKTLPLGLALEWLFDQEYPLVTETQDMAGAMVNMGQKVYDTTVKVTPLGQALDWLWKREHQVVVTTEGMSDAFSDVGAHLAMMGGQMGKASAMVGEMTFAWTRYMDATYNAGSAVDTLGLMHQKLNMGMKQLDMALGDQVGPELERFRDQTRGLEKDAADAREKIAELESLRYRTPAQAEALLGLREDLGATQTAITDLAAEHDRATKQIVFNMVQQQMAADGLSQKEGDLLMQMALKWGLVDQATYDSYGSFITLASGVDATSDSVDTLMGKFENWESWNGRAINLDTFLNVYTQSWTPNSSASGKSGSGGGPGGQSSQYVPPTDSGSFDPGASWYPHAAGGSFMIPPGYTENWRLGGGHTASSGEVVTITPKDRQQSGPVTINIIGANKSPEQIAHEVARVIQRGR